MAGTTSEHQAGGGDCVAPTPVGHPRSPVAPTHTEVANRRTKRGSHRKVTSELSLSRLTGVLASADTPLVIAVLALATALLAFLPSAFGVDSWLALLAGRDIWQHGLPQHETLTVIAHGVHWVDQQWLSQLASYGIYRAAGLGGLGLANVALLVAGVGAAATFARRVGARPRTVMLLLPLCVWAIIPAREVRTQEFAIPLFVAIVWLLARDSRKPTSRVYWSLPILVLWANLHGTVSLGTGLVLLRGLTCAWETRVECRRDWRRIYKPLVLTLGAPVCLLITPYGLRTISYYHATLLNSALKHAVTEWQPITYSLLIAGPFFVLVGIMLWSFGRNPGGTTLWERLALLALAAASIDVIRNVPFFGLAALMLVPLSLDAAVSSRLGSEGPIRYRVNTVATLGTLTALLIAVIGVLVRPASGYEKQYPGSSFLGVVAAATNAHPGIKVLADVRYADWLLWREPALGGHLADDIRYELLSARQIKSLQRTLQAMGPAWKAGATGYRLVVLDLKTEKDSVAGFLAEPGRRVLYDDRQRIVILRPSAS